MISREAKEQYALEHIECMECEVTLRKLTPGEYYCPSCGDYFTE